VGDQRKGGIAWTDETCWCWACKTDHPRGAFGRDPSRPDGRARRCLASRRVTTRKPRTRFKRHGWLVEARDGDRRQARRRVNYLVEQGRLPPPNALPCADCGHAWTDGERRHEYDHHRGYAAEHQLDVQAVCSSCHHAREEARRG